MIIHRQKIMKNMETFLNSIIDVTVDDRMSAKEKYSVVLATLYTSKTILDRMIEEEPFFTDKEFDEIKKSGAHKELFGGKSKDSPDYIG